MSLGLTYEHRRASFKQCAIVDGINGKQSKSGCCYQEPAVLAKSSSSGYVEHLLSPSCSGVCRGLRLRDLLGAWARALGACNAYGMYVTRLQPGRCRAE